MAISRAKKTEKVQAAGQGAGELDDGDYRHVFQADGGQGF